MDDPGLEVEAGREIQVGVRGAREAVDAAVLAAFVGVDGLAKANIRGLIAADDGFAAFGDQLGVRARRRLGDAFIKLDGAPLESSREIAARAPAANGVAGLRQGVAGRRGHRGEYTPAGKTG